MKGHYIPYSKAQMAWLEANRLLPIADYHAGFCEAFTRHDVSAGNLHALRKRKGWKTGRTGCFPKGNDPHNKGVAFPTAALHPNCRKTQFKKGGMSGRAAALYQPIGAERCSKDGYPERKVHDGLPLQSRWRAIHLIRWEEIHGPIPAGHCLKALDADRTNTDPANWELISRALLPRLNGGRHKRNLAYDDASPEVRPMILTLAKVTQGARAAKKRAAA